MAASQDTEITLGTGKLLVLFFGLVAVCALFFAVGYTLGRKSEPSLAAAAESPQIAPGNKKASSGAPAAAAAPMTFYKSVEQKDANAELTPAVDAKTENAPPAATDSAQAANQGQSAGATDMSATTLPAASSYFVQVAAVSKQEDGDALVDALKKKDYPAFVAAQSTSDKLFHVQVGPFADIKDAEAMRGRLVADGYSPILKK